MVLLTKGADELRLIVVKQTLLDEEQRRCKGSYSQKGAATDIKPHLKIYASLVSATDAERPVT